MNQLPTNNTWKSKIGLTRWRGLTLCTDYPPMHILNPRNRRYRRAIIRALSKTIGEKRRCEDIAEKKIAKELTVAYEATIYGEKKIYNPKFWRIVGIYWTEHGCKKKTFKTLRYWLLHILKGFGRENALDITVSEIEGWMYDMQTLGFSNANIMSMVSMMGAIYNYTKKGEKDKRIAINPVEEVTGLKCRVRQHLLTTEKFLRYHAYISEINSDFAFYFFFLWETGRRPEEVAHYTYRMFEDGSCPYMVVPKEITKKEKDDRYPISKELAAEIRKKKVLSKLNDLICPDPDGNIWERGKYQPFVQKIRDKFNDPDFVLRDTRRGFITRKVEVENWDPKYVMILSGHTSNSAFNRYRIIQGNNIEKVANGSNKDTNRSQVA